MDNHRSGYFIVFRHLLGTTCLSVHQLTDANTTAKVLGVEGEKCVDLVPAELDYDRGPPPKRF
jgi:hypothetical protein